MGKGASFDRSFSSLGANSSLQEYPYPLLGSKQKVTEVLIKLMGREGHIAN